MISVRWKNLSLKNQRFTPSGGKNMGIRKVEFVTKTQFLLYWIPMISIVSTLRISKKNYFLQYFYFSYSDPFNSWLGSINIKILCRLTKYRVYCLIYISYRFPSSWTDFNEFELGRWTTYRRFKYLSVNLHCSIYSHEMDKSPTQDMWLNCL